MKYIKVGVVHKTLDTTKEGIGDLQVLQCDDNVRIIQDECEYFGEY